MLGCYGEWEAELKEDGEMVFQNKTHPDFYHAVQNRENEVVSFTLSSKGSYCRILEVPTDKRLMKLWLLGIGGKDRSYDWEAFHYQLDKFQKNILFSTCLGREECPRIAILVEKKRCMTRNNIALYITEEATQSDVDEIVRLLLASEAGALLEKELAGLIHWEEFGFESRCCLKKGA